MKALNLPSHFPSRTTSPSHGGFHRHPIHHRPSHLSFSSKRPSAISASNHQPFSDVKPIVVVGSANADMYLEVDRLPAAGETLAARSGCTFAGGKGANQACCAARLSPGPTHFVARVGDDPHGRLLEATLAAGGVGISRIRRGSEPTGQAVVMLQPDGQNSIVIVAGANARCWPERLPEEDAEVVRSAGALLLQREIPDWVNVQVAQVASGAGVPVILDAGGMEGSIPKDLLKFIDILSPNESELSRLNGMPTDTHEQISRAAMACHKMGVKEVLVKLGSKGSALFVEGEAPIWQPVVAVPKVVDTTGAGDTFTAAFAVALVEGKTRRECLKFAAAAASLCVQVMGTMPSMPDRAAVMNLLHSLSV